MQAIVYDCRDHDSKWAGITLRLIDDSGRMVLQGQVLDGDPRGLCDRIASGLGCRLTWVGPPEQLVAAAEITEQGIEIGRREGWMTPEVVQVRTTQAKELRRLAAAAADDMPAKGGWLF